MLNQVLLNATSGILKASSAANIASVKARHVQSARLERHCRKIEHVPISCTILAKYLKAYVGGQMQVSLKSCH